jgi:elongation factor G
MKAVVWDGDEKDSEYHDADIPAEYAERAAKYRAELLELVASEDEHLMETYLETGDLPIDDLRTGIRKGTLSFSFVPVLCGSAFKNKGVQQMLDAVVDYLPSPLDIPAASGTKPDSEDVLVREADEKAPFAALAFKIVADPFGKLTYFRVYSGSVNKGDEVYNSTKEKRERIGRLLLMHANQREDIDTALAGDIVAGLGFKEVTTGDTLCDRANPIVLERMEFPEPVIHVAIEPKTKNDQDKLGKALKSLSDEDPTFRVRTDEETGQTVISGMGELHLEILVDRMQREFGVDATVGKPQVAYRETVTRKVESVEYRHIKQTGGSGQFAVVKITVEPSGAGNGYVFEDEISGGRIPREYIQPTNQGIQSALDNGVLAGYPTVDVKVSLVDGQYHDVDSSEMAFKIAGQMAFRKAAQMANPIILEPIMAVEVVTPEDYMGDVIGDLSSRRGRIEGMEANGNAQNIRAQVPLSEMFGYSTDLRSRTQGRATYTMQFHSYQPVPDAIAQEIVKRVRGE